MPRPSKAEKRGEAIHQILFHLLSNYPLNTILPKNTINKEIEGLARNPLYTRNFGWLIPEFKERDLARALKQAMEMLRLEDGSDRVIEPWLPLPPPINVHPLPAVTRLCNPDVLIISQEGQLKITEITTSNLEKRLEDKKYKLKLYAIGALIHPFIWPLLNTEYSVVTEVLRIDVYEGKYRCVSAHIERCPLRDIEKKLQQCSRLTLQQARQLFTLP